MAEKPKRVEIVLIPQGRSVFGYPDEAFQEEARLAREAEAAQTSSKPSSKPKIACADCGRETTTTTRVHANEATIMHICGRCLKKAAWKDQPRATE